LVSSDQLKQLVGDGIAVGKSMQKKVDYRRYETIIRLIDQQCLRSDSEREIATVI